MITITIKTILGTARLLGSRQQSLEIHEKATVLDVLNRLVAQYGKPLADMLFTADHQLSKRMIVMVNGRNIYFLDQLATQLNDGDELLLFPPAGGG